MADDSSERFALLEIDPEPGTAIPCKRCGGVKVLNEDFLCRPCFGARAMTVAGKTAVTAEILDAAADATLRDLFARQTLADEAEVSAKSNEMAQSVLSAIAAESAANAAVQGIGSMAGGQLQGAGFSGADGYLTAIRNGVPAHTHAEYVRILRTQFAVNDGTLAELPGPLQPSQLPVGEGIKHVPTGPSVFDRPRSERRFVVGPTAQDTSRLEGIREAAITTARSAADMVAGAVAEGHHAIVAWEGTSGMTRGALLAALEVIGRQAWAPRAPSARAQAGSVIATLGRNGLDVRAQRKGATSTQAIGEHVWTVGRVAHVGGVGEKYGEVTARFRLAGDKLTYTGDASLGDPVLVAYAARMAAEEMKSSDFTSWLNQILRSKLDAVRFGAMGWLIPRRWVADARQLTEALSGAGFGSGWVTGLPVATSDQLRDGIVRGLGTELDETMERLASERAAAADARSKAQAEAAKRAAAAAAWAGSAASSDGAKLPSGDIGPTRAQSFLKELGVISERVIAYGAILGEKHVNGLRLRCRGCMEQLEGILGEDHSGIRARFDLIWEEIERDRAKSGGVL